MPTITLNLEDTILQALKLKATETKQSMSELVNDALKASLQEDIEDLKSHSVPLFISNLYSRTLGIRMVIFRLQ